MEPQNNSEKNGSRTHLQVSNSAIKLPINVAGSIELVTYEQPNRPIVRDDEAFEGFCRLIVMSRNKGDWNTPLEAVYLRDLLKEHEVTIAEAVTAFRKAYGDKYTPATGVEWRHLWTNIEEMRYGQGKKELMTYHEMIREVDKGGTTTAHYERDMDAYDKGIAEGKQSAHIKCWKPKV